MIMKPYKKPHAMVKNEKGFVLVLCLIVMAVLSLLGASALMISSTNQHIVMNYRKQTMAFNVAEAGLQFGLARLRNNPLWRGEETTNPNTRTEYMYTGDTLGWYVLHTYDRTDDNNGTYDPLIPAGYVKLICEGRIPDAYQRIQIFAQLIPDPTVHVDLEDRAIITSGPNLGSGTHVVNGYDSFGNLDNANMVETFTTLPTVDQDGVKGLADFSFAQLTNTELTNVLQEDPPSTKAPTPQTDFWKDPPADTQPWIIHVRGNLVISGSVTLYGIIFVEGDTVDLEGSCRVHGIIYAPNATVYTRIHGGGSPWDQPVMGQVISGDGGVLANGNHADVQLVPEYVEAFRNLGGDVNTAELVAGSWKQF
jgi:hypothetical protein